MTNSGMRTGAIARLAACADGNVAVAAFKRGCYTTTMAYRFVT